MSADSRYGRPASHPRHREGRKKALIVGINYGGTSTSGEAPGIGSLLGPYKDATDFRNLLIKHYNYPAANITLMSDRQGDNHLQPTSNNIRRELENLVKDAQSGDHFTFLYSGHGDQIPTKSVSEDDGMDEVILPLDHEGLAPQGYHKLILDNELKKLLVEPLPIGARLTAIFDSCHSGTLLDLEHDLCNQVYVPWVNKGQRGSQTTMRVYHRERVSGASVRTRNISLDFLESSAGQPRKILVQSRTSSMRSHQTLHPSSSDAARPLSSMEKQPKEGQFGDFGPDIPRCQLGKSGWGLHDAEARASARSVYLEVVIRAWCNFTSSLFVDENPRPTYRALVTRLGHFLHENALMLHDWSKREWRSLCERKRRARSEEHPTSYDYEPLLEFCNFQDPQ
ncbi:Metacaspase-1A, partial [Grifola frondosa]